MGNIGLLYLLQGNYLRALDHFQKSLAKYEALKNKVGIAGALINIGAVYQAQGNYQLALEHYQRALRSAETAGGSVEAKIRIGQALSNSGDVYLAQGDYDSALKYYQQVLKMGEELGVKEGIAVSRYNIGLAHRLQRNYALASEFFQAGYAIYEALGDKAGMSLALSELGVVAHLQGDYTKALEMAGRAAAVARQIVRPDILWEARTTAGKVHLALGQPTLARQAFEEAIATIESLRLNVVGGEQEQQRFFEDKLFPYHAMVELLLAQNQTSEALVFAERAKARVLLDVMRGGRVNVTKAMTADEQEQERSLRSELISLSAQLRQGLQAQPEPADLANLKERLLNARLKYEALQTSLYAAHPELKAQRGEAQTLTPEQAVALLPDAKTALLEFIVAEDKTFLFVLTGNAAAQTPVALKVFSVTIKQKELARLTEQFRQQLAQPGSPVNKLGRELFDLLFKDASPLIRGKDKLVVAPDGPLWEMPFQALLSPRNRYLAQDHAISYAPSLTVLREMIKLRQRKSSEAPTLLAVGNPALGKEIIERRAALMSDRLEPLPDAEKQVRSLSRFYDPRRSKVYVGEAATEARVKTEAGEHGILHMATHGILNDRSPMYSHLVLARTDEQDKEDGLLEAWEIVHLDLRADLAVLSACETARGRVGAGEGMIGLTWAFFVARVPATVVSQWQVRSDSTAELMVEFHRQLQARDAKGTARVTKAEALRRAALKLLGSNQYHHPYFWAGFVVVGDGF